VTTKIEVDYLVIGAGAMGMAFTDTLVTETNATVAVVDRYHQPGGHWTMAYPFVRLHQPSAFYGVNSRPLGSNSIDRYGWNEGLYELATCGEVCAYFDQVMQQQLLPTNRVSYFPMCEYEGEGRFRSVVAEEAFEAKVRRRVVDATYMRVTVPSMRPPAYEVAPGDQCVAPNELVRTRKRYDHYTIVGAGKTGMDACLWLLRQGVDPADLTWIMPRDSWLLDRARVQPGAQFAKSIAAGFIAQRQAIAEATSIDDLFDRLNACGQLLRLTDKVRPTMYRCATVSLAELAQLRRIQDVVRLGRLRRVEESKMALDAGTIPASPGTLYIDCSADGLERRPALPVFEGHRMTLQSVRTCQQVFSAALIAHVEAAYSDEAVKNDFCVPVPHPNSDLDWLHTTLASSRNQLRWSEDPGMREWLEKSRLDYFGNLGPRLPSDPQTRARLLDMLRADASAQRVKLESLLAS
jgi:hypothetical protein